MANFFDKGMLCTAGVCWLKYTTQVQCLNNIFFQIDTKSDKTSPNDADETVTKTDTDKTIVTFVSAESRRRENLAEGKNDKEKSVTSNDIPTMGRDENVNKGSFF